jgi:hypothetical protein
MTHLKVEQLEQYRAIWDRLQKAEVSVIDSFSATMPVLITELRYTFESSDAMWDFLAKETAKARADSSFVAWEIRYQVVRSICGQLEHGFWVYVRTIEKLGIDSSV